MTDFYLPSADIDFISKAGDPPQDADGAMGDAGWSQVVDQWAMAKKTGGDPKPLYFFHLGHSLSLDSMSLQQYYSTFLADGVDSPIPAELRSEAKDVVEGNSDISEAKVKDDLKFYVDPPLINYSRFF
jgi:hypothetical protein